MKRAYLNYFLMGIFIFLLLAGVSSYSVNAEASPLIKMNPGPVSYTHLDVYKRQEYT